MAYNFITCHYCSKKFRNKKLSKPYIGMYKDVPVFQWCLICPSCVHRHTFRYYNVHINPLYDRMVSIEFSLVLNRKSEEKYEELLKQYDDVKKELNMAYDEMKNELVPIKKNI